MFRRPPSSPLFPSPPLSRSAAGPRGFCRCRGRRRAAPSADRVFDRPPLTPATPLRPPAPLLAQPALGHDPSLGDDGDKFLAPLTAPAVEPAAPLGLAAALAGAAAVGCCGHAEK